MISSDSPEDQCVTPKSGELPIVVFLEDLGYSRTHQSITVIEIIVGFGDYESSGGSQLFIVILD